jgi:PKHD-type hydroxylase
MFQEITVLSAGQVAELREIAAKANFVDGRISNPHSKVKQNLQLHDEAAYQRSSQLLTQALYRQEEFQNFAFPVAMLPPMMCRYTSDMRYGAHADAAFLQLGNVALRSKSYDGGALSIRLGTREIRFKGEAGTAIVYPSDMLHEVEPVVSGERLVAITFIQSRIADRFHRETLYELNEIAALEGLKMNADNYTRLQLVQANLLRHWGDRP